MTPVQNYGLSFIYFLDSLYTSCSIANVFCYILLFYVLSVCHICEIYKNLYMQHLFSVILFTILSSQYCQYCFRMTQSSICLNLINVSSMVSSSWSPNVHYLFTIITFFTSTGRRECNQTREERRAEGWARELGAQGTQGGSSQTEHVRPQTTVRR